MPKTVEEGDLITTLCRVPGEAEHAWNGVTREGGRVWMTTQRIGTGSQLVRLCEAAVSKHFAAYPVYQ